MSVDTYHMQDSVKYIDKEMMNKAQEFMSFAEKRYPDLKERISFASKKDGESETFKDMSFKYFYYPAKYFYNFPYKKLGVPLRRRDEEEKVRSALKSAVREYFNKRNPFVRVSLKEAMDLGDIICRIYDGGKTTFVVQNN